MPYFVKWLFFNMTFLFLFGYSHIHHIEYLEPFMYYSAWFLAVTSGLSLLLSDTHIITNLVTTDTINDYFVGLRYYDLIYDICLIGMLLTLNLPWLAVAYIFSTIAAQRVIEFKKIAYKLDQ